MFSKKTTAAILISLLISIIGVTAQQRQTPPNQNSNSSAGVAAGGAGAPANRDSAPSLSRPLPASNVAPIAGVRAVSDGVYRIETPRPLDTAARFLQRKLGIPISYEEPIWVSAYDLVQAADLPQNAALRGKYPGWTGNLTPRNGLLDIILPMDAQALKSTNPAAVLQSVVDSHSKNRNPGEFKLISFGSDEFAIVTTKAEDKNGNLVVQRSPLEQTVSFPEEERSLKATLELILNPVHVGLFNAFYDEQKPRVKAGAKNEKARDVLSRVLRQPGMGKMSWHLNYEPEIKGYVLALTGVQIEAPDVRGVVRLQTVYWPKAN